MNELTPANQAADWHRLKALVLDSVSSPITRGVYNLGLDEFISWYGEAPRPGFTKATVNAWRMALEARGLGPMSINVRITAVRRLAVEAADNGLLAPELAAGITRVKGAKAKGVRVGNWLSVRQAQTLLNAPDVATKKGLRDRAMLAILLGCGLRRSEVAALTLKHVQQRDNRWCSVDLRRQARPCAHDSDADLGEGRRRHVDGSGRSGGRIRTSAHRPRRSGAAGTYVREGRLAATSTLRGGCGCTRNRPS